MQNRKIFSMLALLLTAATGAVAQTPINLTPDATGKKWTLSSMPV